MAYIDMEIDTANLLTPRPLFNTMRAMDKLKPGQVLKITTREANSVGAIEKVCQQLGHILLEVIDWGDEITLLIKKALRH